MRASAAVLVVVLASTACAPDVGRLPAPSADAYQVLLAAEDARPAEGDALAVLLEATEGDDPFLRRIGVRALGRQERPALAGPIATRLSDEDAAVRATAAEALAQAVHGGDGSPVLERLLARVEAEPDPTVRGELARSLGRLRLAAADRRRVSDALVALGGRGADEPEETLLGVALGFESLVRLSPGEGLDRPAADLLIELLRRRPGPPPPPQGDDAGRIRALAASALGATRRLSLELIDEALDDPEPEVRRVVVGYLGALPPSRREDFLRRALADSSSRVRIGGIRYVGALPRTESRCGQLIDAAGPERDSAARLVALAELALACPNFSEQRAALVSGANALAADGAPWQPAARALLSLASVDRDAAARALPAFTAHGNAFVRAWAARAAAVVRDEQALTALAADSDPNVRTIALPGLFALRGHALDALLLEQLGQDDPQLLMTAASLLEGAPDRERTGRALLAALERISDAGRETWRDPRMALLDRLAELGDPSMVARLSPFLADYDWAVAERVGDLLEAWTGQVHTIAPVPLPPAEVPTLAEMRSLASTTLTLHLEGGRTLAVELLAEQAPTNVARLVRLAEEGFYDGLTLHRWAPNFVIQGGSPAANEYQGDGPYTRDEVGGLPHWRGTVGLSTRGRDTGDAQIFVNLVHNPRLNHDYTVMGHLVSGYEALDGVLEGTVIERAEVAPPVSDP